MTSEEREREARKCEGIAESAFDEWNRLKGEAHRLSLLASEAYTRGVRYSQRATGLRSGCKLEYLKPPPPEEAPTRDCPSRQEIVIIGD